MPLPRRVGQPALALLLLVALLAAPPLTAADDLLRVYHEARESDPQLRQARSELETVRERVPQARAGLLPELSAFGSADRERNEPRGSGAGELGTDYYTTSAIGLDLTQPVFRYGLFLRLREADLQVAQAQARLNSAEQDLMVRVTERYFEVLAALDGVAFARAELRAIERQLDQAEQRFEVGMAPVTDVEEARARRDLSHANLLQAETDLDSAREGLRELTGRSHRELALLDEALPLESPEPEDSEAWARQAERQNWDLLAFRHGSEAAMENIGVQRAEHLPTVDLVGNVQRVDQGSRTTATGVPRGPEEFDQASIGLRLNLPLYRGGATRSRVREAQSQYTTALEELEETRRAVVRGATDAYRGVRSAIARTAAFEQAITSTQRALEAVEAGFEVGTRTVVELLDAQQDRLGAEQDFRQANYDYLLQTVRLKRFAGTLSDADLATINTWLDTNAEVVPDI
ncbi:TolC family outer membrane protein [Alkalilimnicola ehrlichii]|uniref:TolC family outer membrane protein n=1 Tax=Alkalilimnicola ehrlichii TaxID=351052 RepID=UPI003B9EA451